MITRKRCLLLLLSVLALTSPIVAGAAERSDRESEAPQLTESVSTELQKVATLIQGSNWDAALLAVNNLLKTIQPGSYDWVFAQLHVAQIYLSRNKRELGDYKNGIPALTAIVTSKYAGVGFFTKDKILEWKYILAQLCAQEDKLTEAERYIREWLAETTAPTADAYVLACTFMVQRAQTDSSKPDKKLMEEALVEIRKGLRLDSKPNETLYYLQAACYQTLERWDDAAETLELMLSRNPRNKTYWSQLLSMYVTAGNDLRAALTIERAQRYETMNTPREQIALAQLYHNMQQFDRAIEILEKGLGDGTIEPVKTNWEMLGNAYLEMHQEFKAINTFIRADKHTTNGHFLALAGNTYYAMSKNADALKYLDLAAKKKVENMGQVTLFGAYLAFELKDYAKASELLDLAKENLADDRQRNDYKGLRDVIEQSIKAETEVKKPDPAEAVSP